MKETEDAVRAEVVTQLSSDDGRQLTVTLKDPVCVDKNLTPAAESGKACAALRESLEAGPIERPGEYVGALALDPLDEDSAAVELTVKARHSVLLPLAVLFLGALGSAVGTVAYTGYRTRKRARIQGAGLRKEKRKRNEVPANGKGAGQPAANAPPAANAEPGGSWGSDLVRDAGGLRLLALDFAVYAAALLLASVAFLLPIYELTNFGSWEHYVSAFAAGVLGKVVVDESLSLVRHETQPKGDAGEGAEKKP